MDDPDVIRGIERVTGETFNAETGQWSRDAIVRAVLIPAGTTVNGAVVALTQDSDDGLVTAELRIDGPPVP